MTEAEVFTKFGKFLIALAKKVYGELRVGGKDTSLYLRDDEHFHPQSVPDGCVTGTRHDLTKVTLIQCLTLEGLSSGSRDGTVL